MFIRYFFLFVNRGLTVYLLFIALSVCSLAPFYLLSILMSLLLAHLYSYEVCFLKASVCFFFCVVINLTGWVRCSFTLLGWG